MFLALPQPIEKLLDVIEDFADSYGEIEGEPFEQMSLGISTTLEALALLIPDAGALSAARRGLLTLGSASGNAITSAQDLQDALAQSDEWLGAEWGGFSRLFQSAVNDGDIFIEPHLRLDGLSDALQRRLMGLQDGADGLLVLHDVADSFAVPSQNAAACIVLNGLCTLYQDALEAKQKPLVDKHALDVFVGDWLSMRGCSSEIAQVFALRPYLNALTPKVFAEFDSQEIARSFCLWFLASSMAQGKLIEGHTRRLVDTLLAKAELAPLSVFEMAGLLP